jgi:hypothetical protein
MWRHITKNLTANGHEMNRPAGQASLRAQKWNLFYPGKFVFIRG